jgi:hypothetical protein
MSLVQSINSRKIFNKSELDGTFNETDKKISDLSLRPKLGSIVFSMKRHDRIIAVQRPTYGDREKTANYLAGLSRDIDDLEGRLRVHQVPFTTLRQLARSEAIADDLNNMGVDADASPLIEEQDHAGHFEEIAASPHRLLAHLAVHYIGFLSGGQIAAPILSRNFGANTVNLYRFDGGAMSLKSQFERELQDYLDTLSDEEFLEYQEEVAIAWNYVIDLFGVDAQKRKSCCDCVRGVWDRMKKCASDVSSSALNWKWSKKGV